MDRFLSVRVPSGLAEALEERAASEQRPVSWCVRTACEAWLSDDTVHPAKLPTREQREALRPLAEAAAADREQRRRSEAPTGCEHKNRRLLNGGLKKCDDCDTTWK